MAGTQLIVAMPYVSLDILRTVGYYSLGDKLTVDLIRADFNFSLDRLRIEKMKDEQLEAEIYHIIGKIKDLQDEQATLQRMFTQEKALLQHLKTVRENRENLLREIEAQPELVRYRDRQWVTAVIELENARDKETGAELGISLLEGRLMDPAKFESAVSESLKRLKESLSKKRKLYSKGLFENFGLRKTENAKTSLRRGKLLARAEDLAELVLPENSTDFDIGRMERVMDTLSLSMRYWLQTFVEKAEADELDPEAMNVFSIYATATIGYGFDRKVTGMSLTPRLLTSCGRPLRRSSPCFRSRILA